jgi:hypothetical protein
LNECLFNLTQQTLAHFGGEDAKLPEETEIQRQLRDGRIDLNKVKVKKAKEEKQDL